MLKLHEMLTIQVEQELSHSLLSEVCVTYCLQVTQPSLSCNFLMIDLVFPKYPEARVSSQKYFRNVISAESLGSELEFIVVDRKDAIVPRRVPFMLVGPFIRDVMT